MVKYEAYMAPIQRIIPAMTFVIAIAYGTYLNSIGDITIGQLLSFTYYLNMLVWPMYALGNFINLQQQAKASMERIWDIWRRKQELKNHRQGEVLKEIGDISFYDHTLTYPK